MQNEIYGSTGNDNLVGTAWNDEIIGRAGNDFLSGNDGNDELYGGAGNDTLSGDAGNDELTGGLGADLFVFTSGHDEIEDFTSAQGDRIRIDPTLGIDSFEALLARAIAVDGGDDTLIDFGNGNSLLIEDVRLSSLSPEWFDFGQVTPLPPGPVPVTPEPGDAIDRITGTAGNDRISGSLNNDRINGLAGSDTIFGGAGNDTLNGGRGDDDMYGGAGNDRLIGGAGDDELYGGAGNDRLVGGAGDDTLNGGAGADVFVFTAGNDVIEDFGEDDVIQIVGNLGVSSFEQLLALAQVFDEDDVLITFASGDRLLLEDVRLTELAADDFVFL